MIMRMLLICFFISLCCVSANAQIGFNKSFDFSEAGLAFSSLEYNGDHTISIYGNLINTNLKHGLLFTSFDTLGNLLDYKVEYDSLDDVFTLVYPNSFIKLADDSGYAGVGAFLYREFGYLAIYNKDGSIQRFVEYNDPNTLTDYYIEIIELSDGFFILGDKQLNDYHTHIFLMKTDKEGNKLWEKLYGHPTRRNGFGSIVKVNDNEYVIGGATTTIPPFPQLVYNTSNFYVIDSLGNLKSSWTSQPSTTDMGVGYGMHRTEQGGLIYATNELYFGPPNNVYERKLKVIERDSDYNIVNEQTYGTFRPSNFLRNFKKVSDGFLVLGQRVFPLPPPGIARGSMLKINSNADSIWNYLDTAFTFATNLLYDAVELPSGSIIACGYSRTTNPLKDWAWLVKVSKDGCMDTLNCFPVSSIEAIKVEKQVKIYPNPASDFIYLDLPEGERAEYQLYDLTGLLIKSGLQSDSKIDISGLPPGGYILQIRARDRVSSKKIIKI
jgi:hypothetical protein